MHQSEQNQQNIWNSPEIVASFRRSRPSASLLEFTEELASGAEHTRRLRILDIGCGAGRNSVPLARAGHTVFGIDVARSMIEAAHEHAVEAGVSSRCTFRPGRMDALPLDEPGFDLIVAHGVWNLAESEETFRAAVAEAARLSRPGASLFVTTFSRNTLPPEAQPVAGTRFVFTDFNGSPQCFLREHELREELAEAGFSVAPDRPVVELNRPAAWEQRHTVGQSGPWRGLNTALPQRGRRVNVAGPKRPVIYEGVWYRERGG